VVPLPDFGGGIGFYRYEGFSLEEKMDWMRQGAGPSALTGAQTALAGLGGALVESEGALRDLVSRLGGTWEGTAGTAAGTAMMVAAAWSAESAPAADDAGTQVGLQTESVERTKYGMPGSAPAPEYGFGDAFGDAVNLQTGNLFDVQTSFDEQVAQRKAADDEANRLLYQHESASRSNLTALPALGEMPRITVDAEPPPTDCLPVVPEQDTVVPPPEVREDVGERPKSGEDDESAKDEKKSDEDKNGAQDKEPGQVEPEGEKPGQVDPQEPSTQDPLAQNPSRDDPVSPSRTDPGSVSAAGYVPDADRPQFGQPQPQSRYPSTASPTSGFGGFGGAFGGGGGAVDTGRTPVRSGSLGAGPVSGGAQPGRGGPAGAGGRGGVAGGRAGGPFASSMGGGGNRGEGEEDGEHSDKYFRGTDELFRVDDLQALDHSVLGADPAEER
jgi:hypothetical protein